MELLIRKKQLWNFRITQIKTIIKIMKRRSLLVVYALIFLISCHKNASNFEYDPTVPYPLLNPGDFWPDKFDQRGLQNAIIYRDRIYCNTIDVGGDANFLYCLNPRNGLVVWRAHVGAFASQPASFQDSMVIYCSYLGDIATFNNDGKMIWKAKFEYPYGGHSVDTTNATLLVKTIYWQYVSTYDIESGKLISKTKNDSLQQLIYNAKVNHCHMKNHHYRFIRSNKTYTVKCKTLKSSEVCEYEIEITK